MSPARGFAIAENDKSCDADSATPSNNTSNAAQNGLDLDALADALAALPEADRPAVVAHVAALARLGPAKRAAILTLTDPDEGKDEA